VSFDQALTDALAHLLVTPTRLAEMRAAMLLQSRPSAAAEVARITLAAGQFAAQCHDSMPNGPFAAHLLANQISRH
ncbi:MAG: hypothetical protein U1E05_20520, partial [Patescibacteria group bacterium]|nr:hypothetical protein [Patescibacteria group bacterium]